MFDRLPILAVCGWSGSGKTTLLAAALARLAGRGLHVAVVKHSAHGLTADAPGKDSGRFFDAGADVLLASADELRLRSHRDAAAGREQTIVALAARYDLILVEGGKSLPTTKIWLAGEDRPAPPPDVTGVLHTLPWDADRLEPLMAILDDFLAERWRRTPVFGCVLPGEPGADVVAPMVRLLRPLCQRVVVIDDGAVGDDRDIIPLPAVADARGPAAGLLAAMRWAPWASWLTVPRDPRAVSPAGLQWLLTTRAPGVWATRPELPNGVSPSVAHYDFRARPLLERLAGGGASDLRRLPDASRIATPVPPASCGFR